MDYLDFEIEIGVGSGREYPIAVLRSVAGEARETMRFPFDELMLENKLLALQNVLLRSGGGFRRLPSADEKVVQGFGQALFEVLFIGEVRSRYAVSQREAFSQGKGLRLKLRIQSPILAALPWEFLYDVGQGEYICLSSNTPIIRYIELPQPPRPLTVQLPLRILGMIASPHNLPSLEVEREKQRVEQATEALRADGLVTLTWLKGQTWQDLQRAMRQGPWHIFHFIGHGRFDNVADEGLVAFADSDGQARYLTATHLARLLADHRSLRLAVLNACEGARGGAQDIFSSTAAILVRRGLPAVLAMQYEITDHAAIELAHVFYEAIAEGLPVDTAVGEARKAISLGMATQTMEWGTPVLYMRAPDGVLFDITQHSRFSLPNVVIPLRQLFQRAKKMTALRLLAIFTALVVLVVYVPPILMHVYPIKTGNVAATVMVGDTNVTTTATQQMTSQVTPILDPATLKARQSEFDNLPQTPRIDGFQSAKLRWPKMGTNDTDLLGCKFDNGGQYLTKSNRGNYYYPCVAEDVLVANLALQISMKIEGDVGGIIFRSDNGYKNYFRLSINQTDKMVDVFSLYRCTNSDAKMDCADNSMDDGGKIDSKLYQIDRTKPILLAVIIRDQNIDLFIGGKYLTRFNISSGDVSMRPGYIGLYGGSLGRDTMVTWSGLKVWSLDGA